MGLIADSGAEKAIREDTFPVKYAVRCVHVMALPASSLVLGCVLMIDPVECTDEVAVARKFRVSPHSESR